MQKIRNISDLRSEVGSWKRQGLRIGFVPTMGALHDGHLSLIDIALQNSDRVVASIFVNPAQFAPHEDLATYPRQENNDCEMLERARAHAVFLPASEDMYPIGHAINFIIGGAAEGLESISRPHFFAGVVKVVAKLFNQVQPDVAVFGEKDYQQLCVIKQLVRDLDFPIEIIGGPIIRDEFGLALSSRNGYLSAEHLKIARTLNRVLFETAEKLSALIPHPPSPSAQAPSPLREREAARDSGKGEGVLEQAKNQILANGFESIDYLELRQADTLAAFTGEPRPCRLLAVARLGGVRLLDNVSVW
jgi:pantoate--beta-alanine ligase